MQYDEFMEKANVKVTPEEFDRIQYVYVFGPHNIIGGFVTEFCNWFNANGGMRAINDMYPFVEAVKKGCEAENRYSAEIEDLKKDIDKLTREVEVYRSIVNEDDLMELIEKRASRDDLIRFISQMGE